MSFDWSTTGLPNPSIDYGAAAEGSVVRTKMESGRFRQRRRFTSGLKTISVVWQFTDDEYALFQGVHYYKISQGADWFDNITLALGQSLETVTARFVGDGYDAKHNGFLEWRVSAKLEVESVTPLSESEVNALLS